MRVLLSFFLLSALLLTAPGAVAQKVVIYRCTDAAGALTVQNDVPCPKGSQQDRRVVEPLPTVAAPRAAIATPPAPATPVITRAAITAASSVATAANAPTIADADRLPPPVMFECRTYDNDRYLSDDGLPPQRCVPMTTTGIGGGSGPAAGEACQMVSDQCQRIADGALCESWTMRLREAQATLRFGSSSQRDAAQAEVDRVGRVVRESTCGM